MEEVKEVSAAESERLQGIISLLSIGDLKCDKCGKLMRHTDRYCANNRECYHCNELFNSIAELNAHFVEKHSPEQPRGTRYCKECSLEAGYLKMVKNKKTGEVFAAMFALRDEEVVEESPKVSKKS